MGTEIHRLDAMKLEDYCKYVNINRIHGITDNSDRPFWSVMIPVCGREKYLSMSLKSVLDQGIDKDRIQIQIVENCHRNDKIKNLVREIGGEEVEYFRQPNDVTINENWNTCIERARGRWIHILHDDDYVLHNFYKSYEKTIKMNPDIEMLFGPSILVDQNGSKIGALLPKMNDVDGSEPDILSILVHNSIACCSVVTSRSLFERIGGFSNDIVYGIDFEMWIRALGFGNIGCMTTPYSAYRQHGDSGSNTDFKNSKRPILETLFTRGLSMKLLSCRLEYADRLRLYLSYLFYSIRSTPSFIRDGGTMDESLRILLSNLDTIDRRLLLLESVLSP